MITSGDVQRYFAPISCAGLSVCSHWRWGQAHFRLTLRDIPGPAGEAFLDSHSFLVTCISRQLPSTNLIINGDRVIAAREAQCIVRMPRQEIRFMSLSGPGALSGLPHLSDSFGLSHLCVIESPWWEGKICASLRIKNGNWTIQPFRGQTAKWRVVKGGLN